MPQAASSKQQATVAVVFIGHRMEEDVLNALQTRTAYLSGSFDRDGKIIFIVNIINDLQSWQRKCLELSITYLKHSLR